MANHDPKNPTPMQPDPKPPGLIPIKSIQFLPGINLKTPDPGMSETNGVTAKEPSASAFTLIGFDPRSQRFRVMWFKAGVDMGRAPTRIKEYPAAICISEPMP